MSSTILLLIWFSCQASAVIFEQSPPQIVDKNWEIQINCKHNDSTLILMLWYQQLNENTSMTLIGSGYEQSPTYEGQASAVIFEQSPPQIVNENLEVQINCKHDDRTLVVMLWYQQKRENASMTLIGFGYYQQSQNYEGQFKEQFTLTRSSTVEGTLTIKKTDVSHSAVYFCAASTQ
ncbi:unnamed protein product [Oreochromis niloticus]|nr:unnamed protein product [Mustela putorius furo]